MKKTVLILTVALIALISFLMLASAAVGQVEDPKALEARLQKIPDELIAAHPFCLPKEAQAAAFFHQGEALYKTGERLAAEKAFRRVIEIDPNSPLAENARIWLSR